MSSEYSDLGREWSLLQNQFDSYEKFSLVIKLIGILVFSAALIFGQITIFFLALLFTVWLQDAIWKTFQARIDSRLQQLEKLLRDEDKKKNEYRNENPSEGSAFQFNTEYLKNRPSGLGLITEYFRQAFRPTIAFPHVVLILIFCVALYLN